MKLFVFVLAATLALGTAFEAQTPVTAKELATEIGNVSAAVKSAEAFAAGLSDGSVKDAALGRVVLLQITRDMLQQRALALRFNITLNYAIGGEATMQRAPAAALVDEIRALEARIQAAQKDAATDALKQIEAASLSVTLAGLQQRALFDRFGIPSLSVIHTPAAPPRAQTAYVPPSPEPPARIDDAPTGPALTIMSIDFQATERNSTFVRYGWKLRVKNNTLKPIRFDALIEFQNAQGFAVDSDTEYGLVLNIQEDREFTGDSLVSAGPAAAVTAVVAKVKAK